MLHLSVVGLFGVGLRGGHMYSRWSWMRRRIYPTNISNKSVKGAAVAQEARGMVGKSFRGDGLDEVIIGAGA